MTEPTPMHVLHVSAWIAGRGGGVSWYFHRLIEHTQPLGIRSTLAGLDDPDDHHTPAGVPTITAAPTGPGALGYARGLARRLDAAPTDIDLVHLHGLRALTGSTARRFARKRALPLVISPHGQLDPWVLDEHRFRKRLLAMAFDDRNLRAADCFLATCAQEARHIRAYGLHAPVAAVPIGLDPTPYLQPADEDAIARQWPALAGKRRLLYLTTIYRKKGLLTLAEAWARIHRDWPDWRLVVGGHEVHPLIAPARQILARAGAEDRALFLGPVPETAKRLLMAGSDVYVLPTRGENFGISVAESLASATPVIVSRTAPWADLERRQCGWWIDVGVEPLCRALTQAMRLSRYELRTMGQRGRELIQQQYRWPDLARQVRDVYAWLLRRGPQPGWAFRTDQPLPGA